MNEAKSAAVMPNSTQLYSYEENPNRMDHKASSADPYGNAFPPAPVYGPSDGYSVNPLFNHNANMPYHSATQPMTSPGAPDPHRQYPPLPEDQQQMILNRLCAQVEFYFSPQNLLRDDYLRTWLNMPEHYGCVPLAVICQFPRVRELSNLFWNCHSINRGLTDADPTLVLRAIQQSALLCATADGNFLMPRSPFFSAPTPQMQPVPNVPAPPVALGAAGAPVPGKHPPNLVHQNTDEEGATATTRASTACRSETAPSPTTCSLATEQTEEEETETAVVDEARFAAAGVSSVPIPTANTTEDTNQSSKATHSVTPAGTSNTVPVENHTSPTTPPESNVPATHFYQSYPVHSSPHVQSPHRALSPQQQPQLHQPPAPQHVYGNHHDYQNYPFYFPHHPHHHPLGYVASVPTAYMHGGAPGAAGYYSNGFVDSASHSTYSTATGTAVPANTPLSNGMVALPMGYTVGVPHIVSPDVGPRVPVMDPSARRTIPPHSAANALVGIPTGPPPSPQQPNQTQPRMVRKKKQQQQQRQQNKRNDKKAGNGSNNSNNNKRYQQNGRGRKKQNQSFTNNNNNQNKQGNKSDKLTPDDFPALSVAASSGPSSSKSHVPKKALYAAAVIRPGGDGPSFSNSQEAQDASVGEHQLQKQFSQLDVNDSKSAVANVKPSHQMEATLDSKAKIQDQNGTTTDTMD